MSRKCLPLVEPEAVKLALRAITKVEEDLVGALRYGLKADQKQALRAGQPIVVKRDSKLAREIITKLLPAIDEGHNVARRQRLVDGLRTAFGEKAFDKAERYLNQRARYEIAPDLRDIEFWGKGMWIAPYRSPNGLLVVVALDECGRIAFSAEITGARSGLGGSEGDEFKATDAPNVTFDGGKLIEQGSKFADYLGEPLARGIHIMPWRPWHDEKGAFLVAVDDDGWLVASTTSSGDASEIRDAKLDLAWMLGLFGRAKYVDRYLADDEEDIDDLGEEWKRDS